MFTGLVEGIGRVSGVSHSGGDMKISVSPDFDISDCRIGDSISVDGVCLTITGIKKDIVEMDVSRETVSISTIGSLKQGNRVNLERALSFSGRLGGHLVSGHVDGIGKILKMEQIYGSWLITIGLKESLTNYIVEKGSIAVDGISLTVNRCEDTFFEVNIIPETGRETNILRKKIGESVNIETDLIAKYIEKFINRERRQKDDKASSRIDQEMLSRYGFGD